MRKLPLEGDLPTSDLPVCFVCFDTSAPTWSDVGAAVLRRLQISEARTSTAADDGSLLLTLSEGQVAVVPVDAGFATPPDNDLSQRAIWPNLGAAQPLWQSHVIVAPFAGHGTFEARRENIAAAVRTASAYASLDSAAAVFWSGNGLFIPPASFVALVEADTLHPEFIVRCRWWRKPGVGVGARTAGLAQFGLPELSHPPTGENAGAIHSRLLRLGRCLVERGPAFDPADLTGLGLDAQVWVEETQAGDGRSSLVVHRSELQAFT